MIAAAEGLINIALIEPDARDVARVKELVLTGSLPARIADVMAYDRPDLAEAEIILIGIRQLGPTEKEALARLHAGFPGVPLIVLAGPEAAARSQEALSLGAHHVLAKNELTTDKLSSTLRFYAHYVSRRLTHTAQSA